MATLETIIADALEFADRPDLLSPCRKVMRSILFEAHGISDFHRDLAAAATEAGAKNNVLALPANFRKLSTVLAYDEDATPLTVVYHRKTAEPFVDTWGFQNNAFLYYIAGGNLTLQHNESYIPDKVGYVYYKYPTFTTAGDGIVSTDSWMPDKHEAYLRNKLLAFMAARTGNTAALQVANADLQQCLSILLASDMDGLS